MSLPGGEHLLDRASTDRDSRCFSVFRMESNFIGSTLTNIIIVVERIFRNLNARQLNTCSRVCKVWRDQAKRERERRKYLRWNFFLHDNTSAVEGVDTAWWTNITSFLLESPIEPKCLLIFCSHSLWALVTEKKPQGKKKKRTEISAAELLGPYLPRDCMFHVVLTDGIVGTDADMKTLELDREECDEGLSLIMFGESSEMKFVPFALTHQECVSLTKYWSEANGRIPQCMQPLINKQIKMINLYCPMNGIDQEIGYSLFRIFNWPLVAGGYVNEKHVRDSHGNFSSSVLDKSCVVSGLAICGVNVKVASVLLRGHDIADVDSTVQALTEHKFPLHRSFGLMYACVGRGAHVYGKQNVESSIFRKYFPNTPLLGFFGNGEVGCNFPPVDPLFVGDAELRSRIQSSGTQNSSSGNSRGRMSDTQLKRQLAEMRQKQEAYKMKHPPKILHAYTTVMCLVSLP